MRNDQAKGAGVSAGPASSPGSPLARRADSSAGQAAPPGAWFPGLEGLRGLAALAVVLTHIGFQTGEGVNGPLRVVLSRLDLGVAVFFVLSGFLLHRPQALAALGDRPLPAVLPYLWRRALRVLPAYGVAVVAALLLVPGNADRGAAEWLWQLTLTQVYADGHLLDGFTQVWSLCTEVAFYLALPLLGRLAARGATGVRARLRGQLLLCAAMAALSLAWQWAVADGLLPLRAGLWLPGHADWFAAGMAVAAVSAAQASAPGGGWWARLEDVAGDAGTCWIGAAALFAVAGTPVAGSYSLVPLSTDEALLRAVLYTGVAVLLLLPAVLPGRRDGVVRGLLTSPVIAFLGRVSYGVFVLHLVVLDLTLRALQVPLFTGRALLVTAVVVPVSVLAGWLSLVLVERPALRLRRLVPRG